MFEDANEINQKPKIEEGQTMQWPKEKRQDFKQCCRHIFNVNYRYTTYLLSLRFRYRLTQVMGV
jgi:hypothetical protein